MILKKGVIMLFPYREDVKEIREEYPAGCKVRLLRMADSKAPPVGTIGTVTGVDDTATVHVDWSNGSKLGIIYGVDAVEKID